MISRSLLGGIVLLAFSAPAMAFHCPLDVKAIDNALPKANLSASQEAEVKELRDKGNSQHHSGDHAGAEKTLAEAMRIILNNL